jgi:hypothetical protein
MKTVSGWGNYPKCHSNNDTFFSTLSPSDERVKNCIARGLGRSYGDASLSKNIFISKDHNKIISFDTHNGVLTAKSNVSINELNQLIIQHGWIIPVSPGTSFVTLAGAIASDVHGKNHHIEGSFSNCVQKFILFTGSEYIEVDKNSFLFKATLGGMGLTGIITEVTLNLKKIKSSKIVSKNYCISSIDEAIELFENHSYSNYTVSWLDFLNKKGSVRGIFSTGEHDKSEDLKINKSFIKLTVPKIFPSFLINDYTISAFNNFYYKMNSREIKIVELKNFFYPLDNINKWNRVYGADGFIQFQFVLPVYNFNYQFNYLLKFFKDNDLYPYLTVLKKFGAYNNNYLSFPFEGFTLALDFKFSDRTLKLLKKLTDFVIEAGGRFYLAKDSIMNEQQFKKSSQETV